MAEVADWSLRLLLDSLMVRSSNRSARMVANGLAISSSSSRRRPLEEQEEQLAVVQAYWIISVNTPSRHLKHCFTVTV